jgi:hypothetical protein
LYWDIGIFFGGEVKEYGGLIFNDSYILELYFDVVFRDFAGQLIVGDADRLKKRLVNAAEVVVKTFAGVVKESCGAAISFDGQFKDLG